MNCLRTGAIACLAWLALLGTSAARAAESTDVVIVVDASSPIHSIALADVRRRYLGVPVVVDGVEVTPIRNLSEATTYEVFLQRVLFMSAQNFERRMVTRIFSEGGRRIATVSSQDELNQVLHDNPGSISFARRAVVGGSLRIVAEP